MSTGLQFRAVETVMRISRTIRSIAGDFEREKTSPPVLIINDARYVVTATARAVHPLGEINIALEKEDAEVASGFMITALPDRKFIVESKDFKGAYIQHLNTGDFVEYCDEPCVVVKDHDTAYGKHRLVGLHTGMVVDCRDVKNGLDHIYKCLEKV